MAAADLEVGVVLEAEEFGEAQSGNDGRLQRTGTGRYWDLSIDADPEAGQTRIVGYADCGVAVCPAWTGRVASRGHHVDGLGEADSQHRNDHALHGVDSIVSDTIPDANDGLLVAHQVA